jgi:hypothetical protein
MNNKLSSNVTSEYENLKAYGEMIELLRIEEQFKKNNMELGIMINKIENLISNLELLINKLK